MIITSTVDQFIQDGLFLRNWSPRTANIHRKAIVPFCPSTITKASLNAMVAAMRLNDSGVRINEALTLECRNADFDNLVIRVNGKGNRERLIPISVEGRKSV